MFGVELVLVLAMAMAMAMAMTMVFSACVVFRKDFAVPVAALQHHESNSLDRMLMNSLDLMFMGSSGALLVFDRQSMQFKHPHTCCRFSGE